jgi:oligopeptide transport system substrate-binding protein
VIRWSALRVVVAAFVAGCTTPPAVPGSPPDGQGIGAPAEVIDPDAQLVTSAGPFGEPRTIDPARVSLSPELEIVRFVFEGLLVLDPTTLQPAPAAAELPVVSADLKTFTFTLRPGMTYSDGAPLVAADFAYAYARSCESRVRTESSTALFVIAGCERLAATDPRSADFTAARDALGVKALDERRIEFKTVEPAPYFPAITTLPAAMPVRRSDVARGDSWAQPGTYIGNGPFKLVSWQQGQSMVFERNDRYRVPVKLKSWRVVFVPDRAVEFAGYRNNQIDMMGIGTEEMRAVDANAALRSQLVRVPVTGTSFYAFNTSRAPFDDPAVRLAFAKSVDRVDFVKKILGGLGRPADRGFIPTGTPGYDDGDRVQAFDPPAARRLLASSSYGGSPLPPITFSIWATNVNTLHAQWLREQWKTNLGVEVTVEPIENPVYQRIIQSPQTAPHIFFTGWYGTIPDPYSYLVTVWGPGGVLSTRTDYDGAQFNAALARAFDAVDATRRDAYQAAGRILSSDAAGVWLYYPEVTALVKPWVKGLRPSASGLTALGKHEIYVIKH